MTDTRGQAGAGCQFWQSRTSSSVLRYYDLVFATVSVVNISNFLPRLLRMERYATFWCHMAFTVLMLAQSVAQLVWIMTSPRSYARSRLPFMLFGRVLRLSCIAASALPLGSWLQLRQPDFLDTCSWDVLALARTSPYRAALRCFLLYSGTSMGLVHAFVSFVPLQYCIAFQVLHVAVSLPLMQRSLQLLESAAVLPGTREACTAVSMVLAWMTGMGTQPDVCALGAGVLLWTCQLSLSLLLPCYTLGSLELYLRRVHHQQQEAQHAATQHQHQQRGPAILTLHEVSPLGEPGFGVGPSAGANTLQQRVLARATGGIHAACEQQEGLASNLLALVEQPNEELCTISGTASAAAAAAAAPMVPMARDTLLRAVDATPASHAQEVVELAAAVVVHLLAVTALVLLAGNLALLLFHQLDWVRPLQQGVVLATA